MTETKTSSVREIRQSFPFLNDCVYLNTASVGICPTGVGAAAARYYDEVRSRGCEGRHTWRQYEHDVRQRLARLLRVPKSVIEFTGSTTESLNLVAQSMKIAAGEQVVFPADDFPSVRLAWEPHEKRGVELVRVPVPKEEERTEAVAEAVGERTKAVCVSHVHWNTGTRIDLHRLATACARHGAKLIVDGAQAAGAIESDASCADAYTASTFKWLLSDFGLAFLAVKEELRSQLEPVFRGYANEAPSTMLRYAHPNHAGIGLLDTSLAYLESTGWPLVLQRVTSLSDLLYERLVSDGWDVVTPGTARAGIVTIAHPEASALGRKLSERRCMVEVREAMLRFSPHFYNDEEDIERLAEALTLARSASPTPGGTGPNG